MRTSESDWASVLTILKISSLDGSSLILSSVLVSSVWKFLIGIRFRALLAAFQCGPSEAPRRRKSTLDGSWIICIRNKAYFQVKKKLFFGFWLLKNNAILIVGYWYSKLRVPHTFQNFLKLILLLKSIYLHDWMNRSRHRLVEAFVPICAMLAP